MGLLPAAALVAALLAPSADAERLFVVDDPAIDEASGIAIGVRSPDVFYVHNDSADEPRFFALDARTGETRAQYDVRGAAHVDYEDIAVHRSAGGRSVIWLADIGDNDRVRDEAVLYRVREPRVTRSDTPLPARLLDTWRVRYPDGARDGEALLVHPDGRLFNGTRSLIGATEVFEVPQRPGRDGVRELRKVASVQIRVIASPSRGATQLMVTGGAISPDGRVMVLRTYTDAYVWRLPDADVAAALRRHPVRIALPEQRQGEGVTVVGPRLIVNSEAVGSPVYAVPLPAPGNESATPSATTATTPTAEPDDIATGVNTGWGGVLATGALTALAVGALVVLWRARRSNESS